MAHTNMHCNRHLIVSLVTCPFAGAGLTEADAQALAAPQTPWTTPASKADEEEWPILGASPPKPSATGNGLPGKADAAWDDEDDEQDQDLQNGRIAVHDSGAFFHAEDSVEQGTVKQGGSLTNGGSAAAVPQSAQVCFASYHSLCMVWKEKSMQYAQDAAGIILRFRLPCPQAWRWIYRMQNPCCT